MKDYAVFTIVRNEPFFLPVWCDYYARNFGEENLYVLDNSTTDSSVNDVVKRWPKINVRPVPSDEALLYAWTTEVAKSFQRAALKAHRCVVFADADEFLVPGERYRNLRAYCDEFLASSRQYVRSQGWAVVHQIDSERAATSDDILRDRNSMWRAPLYDKTLISKVPLNWAKGIHTIYDSRGVKLIDDPVDTNLVLFHARDVDLGVMHRRCVDRSKMKITQGQTTHGSTNIEELKTYFRSLTKPWVPDMSWVPGHVQAAPELVGDATPVPNHWRRALNST